MEIRLTRHADVTAVLSDPRYAVPAVPAGGRSHSLAWLRRTVCRFSEGAAHERRRALVEDELARMDPQTLRREAREMADRTLDKDPDVVAVARTVPVAVLGRALGVQDLDALVAAVPVAAAVYLTGSEDPARADEAVATLVRLLGPGPDETVANRIAVLMQACESTAALIGNTTRLARNLPDPARWRAERLVAETLRYDPPIPVMRRVAREDTELSGRQISAGALVELDLRAANRDPEAFTDPDRFDPSRTEPAHLTFGAGWRPCPGSTHAQQLAAAVTESILRN